MDGNINLLSDASAVSLLSNKVLSINGDSNVSSGSSSRSTSGGSTNSSVHPKGKSKVTPLLYDNDDNDNDTQTVSRKPVTKANAQGLYDLSDSDDDADNQANKPIQDIYSPSKTSSKGLYESDSDTEDIDIETTITKIARKPRTNERLFEIRSSLDNRDVDEDNASQPADIPSTAISAATISKKLFELSDSDDDKDGDADDVASTMIARSKARTNDMYHRPSFLDTPVVDVDNASQPADIPSTAISAATISSKGLYAVSDSDDDDDNDGDGDDVASTMIARSKARTNDNIYDRPSFLDTRDVDVDNVSQPADIPSTAISAATISKELYAVSDSDDDNDGDADDVASTMVAHSKARTNDNIYDRPSFLDTRDVDVDTSSQPVDIPSTAISAATISSKGLYAVSDDDNDDDKDGDGDDVASTMVARSKARTNDNIYDRPSFLDTRDVDVDNASQPADIPSTAISAATISSKGLYAVSDDDNDDDDNDRDDVALTIIARSKARTNDIYHRPSFTRAVDVDTSSQPSDISSTAISAPTISKGPFDLSDDDNDDDDNDDDIQARDHTIIDINENTTVQIVEDKNDDAVIDIRADCNNENEDDDVSNISQDNVHRRSSVTDSSSSGPVASSLTLSNNDNDIESNIKLDDTIMNMEDTESPPFASKIKDARQIKREKYRRLRSMKKKNTFTVILNNCKDLLAQGDYVALESLLRHIVSYHRKVHGRDHIKTHYATRNLGNLLTILGKHKEAEKIFTSCIEYMVNKYGYNHHDSMDLMDALANSYYCQKKYDKAEKCYRENLHLRMINTDGNSHNDDLYNEESFLNLSINDQSPKVDGNTSNTRIFDCKIVTMNNLAGVLSYLNRHDEAEGLYEESLHARRQELGNVHKQTMLSICNLGVHYFNRGNLEKGEALYLECLEICSQYYVNTTHHYDALYNLALLYIKKLNYTKSSEYLKQLSNINNDNNNDNNRQKYMKLLSYSLHMENNNSSI